jgi:phosphate uptake regulator
MFERIRALISGRDLIRKAYDETFAMMDIVAKLYVEATSLLLDAREPAIDIHKEDKRINDMEMDIRRDILEHLAINPKTEVSASLILSAVVGYVERIGDYAKNIEELGRMYRLPLRRSQAAAPLVEATEQVGENMRLARQAFAEEDRELAIEVIRRHKRASKTFDGLVGLMFENDALDKDEALTCAMYARYLKRISAGLKNVCTSVAVPFDRIGYSKILGPELEAGESAGET